MTPPPSTASAAVRYAALSTVFDPEAALGVGVPGRNREDLTAVASWLSAVCDVVRGENQLWQMQTPARQSVISGLLDAGMLDHALQERSAWPQYDDEDRTLGELLGSGADGPSALSEQALNAAFQAIKAGERPEFPALNRLWRLLEMAAPVIGQELPRQAQALLDRQTSDLRAAALLDTGFEGRNVEIERLRAWLKRRTPQPPVVALYIQGLPAIGKSTLLEKVIADLGPAGGFTLIRLDFDRTGLDPRDRLRLTIELARQVAAQNLPAASWLDQAIRQSLANLGQGRSSAIEIIPPALKKAIEAALPHDQPLIFLLDTLEALAARGPAQIEQLFRWLDDIAQTANRPVSVLAGGRADGRRILSDRWSEESIVLASLQPSEVGMLMERLSVPSDLRAQVAEVARGNPLRLKLASQAALTDPGSLQSAEAMDVAHLYRTLQSRIPDPDVSRLLDPGLLLRRVSFEAFTAIIAPFFRLHRSHDELETLFKALIAQTWLFEPDPRQPGWYRQPASVRRLVVTLMVSNRNTRRLHRSAALWLMRQPSGLEQADGLFHRLQGGSLPDATAINPEVASLFDEAMLRELAPEARRAVLWARGDLSSRFEGPQPVLGGPSPVAARNLAVSLDKGDLEEAAYLYRDAFKGRYVPPNSEEADVLRAYLWRSGAWRRARSSLRERDLVRSGDADLQTLFEKQPSEIAFCRVEMRAEFAPKTLQTLILDPDASLWLRRLYERDARNRLRGGAADFLLRRIDIRAPGDRRGDVVDMVQQGWGQELWERLGSELQVAFPPHRPSPDSIAGRAEICKTMARFNPMAAPVRVKIGADEVERRLKAMEPELTALIQDQAPVVYESLPSAYEALVATGWFSEWLSLEAFRSRDGDLTVLSQRAEAWRQTVAGRWRFGQSPHRGFGALGPVDVVTQSRVFKLLQEPDPVRAATEVLRVWSVKPADPRIIRMMQSAGSSLERRRPQGEHPILKAARRLQGLHAPSAIVPALAVLTVRMREE